MSMEEKNLNTEQDTEVLFEVETIPSRESNREFVDLFYMRRMYFGYTTVCLLFFIADIAANIAWSESNTFMPSVVITPIMLTLMLMTRHRRIRAFEKNMDLLAAAKPPEAKKLYGDEFVVSGYTFRYEQVSKVVVGKVATYLVGKGLFIVALSKSEFTTGTYSEFLTFLSEKFEDNPKLVRALKKEQGRLVE